MALMLRILQRFTCLSFVQLLNPAEEFPLSLIARIRSSQANVLALNRVSFSFLRMDFIPFQRYLNSSRGVRDSNSIRSVLTSLYLNIESFIRVSLFR